jgi:hypothetical protein
VGPDADGVDPAGLLDAEASGLLPIGRPEELGSCPGFGDFVADGASVGVEEAPGALGKPPVGDDVCGAPLLVPLVPLVAPVLLPPLPPGAGAEVAGCEDGSEGVGVGDARCAAGLAPGAERVELPFHENATYPPSGTFSEPALVLA